MALNPTEALLDSCHALMNYGVDRFRRPKPISAEQEQQQQIEREEYLQQQVNDLWRTIPQKEVDDETVWPRFPVEPQENLLYFIEKNAPLLEPWEREIVRIVRKIAQYFYPQRQTRVMNEGWATFWHYTLLNKLYDEGLVNDGFMLEILQSHTNVIFPARIRLSLLQRHQPLHASVTQCSPTFGAFAKHRATKTSVSFRKSPVKTGWTRSTTRWKISKTKASYCSFFHPRSFAN